ncbi:hypothetical protein ACIHFD_49650 [Nonomuraea sp. NPDC051941]|uniref:hypothetical protein n=1 Tax=Nonomuraea sp. NPDC051941 TaxID=3364373 RepID=UPI0037C94941
MAGTAPIYLRITTGLRDRLVAHTAAEVARREELLQDPRWEITRDMPARKRAAIRGAARAYVAGLRERGELLDTQDVFMTHAVQAELRQRGWDHDWPPIPDNAPRSGRWPGSLDRGWAEKLTLSLPTALAERARAACFHTSADAIDKLRAWRDRHPEVVTEATAPTAYQEYMELARQVTTTGDLWRAALDNALPALPAGDE